MQNPHWSAPVAAKAAASSSPALGRHALERGDRRSLDAGQREVAAHHRLAVHEHRAAPALTRRRAAVLRRGDVELLTERGEQVGVPVVDGHLGAVEREVRAHRAQASSPPVGLSTTGRRRREALGRDARESRPWPPRSSPTRVAAPGPPEAAPSSPSPSTAACRTTRSPPLVAAPGPRRRAGAGRAPGQGRVEPAGAARVQDARRVVGDLPGARRAARRRAGVGEHRRAARRRRAARAALADRRHRRQPRPGGGPDGPAARVRRPHLRAGRDRAPPASTASRPRAPRSTVVDGTYDDAVAASAARPRDDVLVISDTSWEGYDAGAAVGDRGLLDDLRGGRRAAPRGAAPTSSSSRWASAPSPRRWSSTSRPMPRIVAVEPLRRRVRAPLRGGGPPGRGARPARLDHGRPQLRDGLGRRLADSSPPGSTCSSRSTTRPPSGPCATSPRSASWPARPARPAWPGLRALVESGSSPVDLAGRSALVICTEGATDPVAYERIVSGRA